MQIDSSHSGSMQLESSARSSAKSNGEYSHRLYKGTISSVPSAHLRDRRAITRCKCSRSCIFDFLSAWTSHLQTVALIAVLSVYLLVGAVIFQRLEGPHEHELIEHAVENHSLLARTKAHIIGNLTANGTISEAEALELVYIIGNISASEAKLRLTHNWDFGPSVFFVTTVITTIGYGSIAPETQGGRIFLIFYALGGIPIALIFLATMGKVFDRWVDFGIQLLGRNLAKRRIVKIVALIMFTLLGLCFFVFLPSIAFDLLEQWNYFESVYFSFVTLTTIGFGDFVTSKTTDSLDNIALLTDHDGEHLHGLYRICTAVWIWFGLAFISLLITRIQNTFAGVGSGLQMCWLQFREKRKIKNHDVRVDRRGNVEDAIAIEDLT